MAFARSVGLPSRSGSFLPTVAFGVGAAVSDFAGAKV